MDARPDARSKTISFGDLFSSFSFFITIRRPVTIAKNLIAAFSRFDWVGLITLLKELLVGINSNLKKNIYLSVIVMEFP